MDNNKSRENRILELAREWLGCYTRTHDEIVSYVDGVTDALIAAYEDTMRGAYLAGEMREALAKMIAAQ